MRWPRLIFRWLGARPTQECELQTEASLVLPVTLIEEMRDECERGLPNETGGVLVGHVDQEGRTRVTAVVGPGSRALHTRNLFRRDGEYAQAEVDRLFSESGGRDDYVGEWHSHPQSVPASSVDRESMEWIGSNERYRRDQPVLIIMQRTRERGWRPLSYRWVQGRLTEVRWAPESDSWPP